MTRNRLGVLGILIVFLAARRSRRVLGIGLALVAAGVAQQPQTAGAKREIASALREICPRQELTRSRDGRLNGCVACPEQTGMRQQWVGQWRLRSSSSWPLTAAGADDLLISGIGCEPHIMNYGGTFVFRIQHGRAKLLYYNQGLRTDSCKAFHVGSGRDQLVCRNLWQGWGTALTSVYAVAFDAHGKAKTTPIFTVRDTVAACGADVSNRPPWVERSRLTDLRLGLDTRGGVRLEISATLGRARLSPAWQKACLNALRNGVRLGQILRVKAPAYRIAFRFRHGQFVVERKSRAALARFPRPEVF